MFFYLFNLLKQENLKKEKKLLEMEEIDNSKILTSLKFYLKSNLEIESTEFSSKGKALKSNKFPNLDCGTLNSISYYNDFLKVEKHN